MWEEIKTLLFIGLAAIINLAFWLLVTSSW